jgi:hypothetical protein
MGGHGIVAEMVLAAIEVAAMEAVATETAKWSWK